MSSMVKVVDIHLYKTILDEILDDPMEEISSMKDKVTSLEFV